jgi:hypothetical protein
MTTPRFNRGSFIGGLACALAPIAARAQTAPGDRIEIRSTSIGTLAAQIVAKH